MREMRLRQKKPTNIYIGQANEESDEEHYDDNNRNRTPGKKEQRAKQASTNKKTKGYASILCEFVSAVNTDYKNYCNKYPPVKPPQKGESRTASSTDSKGAQKNPSKNVSPSPNVPSSNSYQNPIKTAPIPIKESPPVRSSKRQNDIQPDEPQKTQTQNPQPQPVPPVPQKIAPSQPPPQRQIPPAVDFSAQIPNQATLQLQLQQHMQQMIQNQQYPLNAMYGGMMPYYQYPQSYMEQMKNNPMYAYANMFGMMPQNFQNLGQYVQYMQGVQQQMQQKTVGVEKRQESKGVAQEQMMRNQKNQGKNVNKTSLQKSNVEKLSYNPKQTAHFKKKSVYHVAIAYDIHFANLKQKGIQINKDNFTQEEIQKMDPTFPAKRVRKTKN